MSDAREPLDLDEVDRAHDYVLSPCVLPSPLQCSLCELYRHDAITVTMPALVAELRAARETTARARELIKCLVENDPDDMAADAITVLMVWRKDAAEFLKPRRFGAP